MSNLVTTTIYRHKINIKREFYLKEIDSMKFIKSSVPDVKVESANSDTFEIKSMQYLDESDDRVYLKCAEYVEQFKRGFVCDLVCEYETVNANQEDSETQTDNIRDLVLVYVNKTYDNEYVPVFEYIFFK